MLNGSKVSKPKEISLLRGGQRILVISPQSWDWLKVSKHHYAEALARMGNKVYFLNPFSRLGRPGRKRISTSSIENLFIIDQQALLPLRWFPASGTLSQICIKQGLKSIAKVVGSQFDLSWNFDNSSGAYLNQAILPAGLRIFQPVDRVPELAYMLRGADIVISVAQNILDDYLVTDTRKLLVPHAIGSEFVEFAEKLLENKSVRNLSDYRINVGYFGNLELPALNRGAMQKVIELFPDIEFHFFGPYERNMARNSDAWYNYSNSVSNLKLHGFMTPSQILRFAESIDLWLICYDRELDRNAASNSHKVTEYLATGRAVVSSRIDAYEGQDNLITMATDDSSEAFISAFRYAIENLGKLSTEDLMLQRVQFAISRSCQKVIGQIDDWVKSQQRMLDR